MMGTAGEVSMWGQQWGEMIWGTATRVPVFGAGGALLLVGFLLGVGATRLPPGGRRKAGFAVLSMILALSLSAWAVTIPNVFVNGTVADAGQVNANFTALKDAVDAGMPITFYRRSAVIPIAGQATVATLSLPVGTYLLQAKVRFRATATVTSDAACVFQRSDGTSFGATDATASDVPPGFQVDGYMATPYTLNAGDVAGLRVQCFGTNLEVLNPNFWATPAVFTTQ
jgi:hypothetical protein